MKKKQLEILLQKIPSFNNPIPGLEQYKTSADIAADIIFTAHQLGDIENKIVIDMGCGTGIFSVGSFLTGAKKVIGIDIEARGSSASSNPPRGRPERRSCHRSSPPPSAADRDRSSQRPRRR